MKVVKKLGFVLLVWLLLNFKVNAAVIVDVNNTTVCSSNTSLYLAKVGETNDLTKGGKYYLNYYNFYPSKRKANNKRDPVGMVFCISPAKTSDYNSGEHTCKRPINPKTGALDVALTYAYQQMIYNRYSGNSYREIAEMAFRWILDYFGELDTKGDNSDALDYASYGKRGNNNYYIQNKASVKNAIKIAESAVYYGQQVKNGTTNYQNLVNAGVIWADQWNVDVTDVAVNGNITTLTISISVKNPAKKPATVNWNMFEFTCGSGYICSRVSYSVNAASTAASYVVNVNTASGNVSVGNYGMTISAYFQDHRSAEAYLMMYNPVTNGKQKMMAIINNRSDVYSKSSFAFQPKDMCVCQKVGNTYNNNYVWLHTIDSVTKATVLSHNDPRAITNHCPAKCLPDVHKCEKINNPTGAPTYYGSSGAVVNQATYIAQCTHTCQEVPNSSGSVDYYCANKSGDPDKGGEKCVYRDYLEDCYCEPNKQKCYDNPSDPICTDYFEKCPNCDASVSMPGTCNKFKPSNVIEGTISDINKEVTSCNINENPVKRCVIDGVDQANNEYKIAELADNQYCHVYCDEEYTFKVPTAQYSTSGGYFNLSTVVSGTRNCYIGNASNPDEPLDANSFAKTVEELSKSIIENWNVWNKWNTLDQTRAPSSHPYAEQHSYTWNYNVYDINGNKTVLRATEEISKNDLDIFINTYLKNYQEQMESLSKKVADYSKCTTFHNNMKFEPEITFNYKDYVNLLGLDESGKFSRASEVETSVVDTYCFVDTDEHYKCLGNEENPDEMIITSDDNSVLPDTTTLTGKYINCNAYGCQANNYAVSKAKWIQKTTTKSAVYVPDQNFSTFHQYGTVTNENLCLGNIQNCLWTKLPSTALPVELKTNRGAFPFVLKFNNIGQSNQNENLLGRLAGSDNSVVNAYNNLDDNKKCSYNKDATTSDKNTDTYNQNTGYTCSYINNCDDCQATCENKDCIIKECDNCKVSCRTCIFDGTNTTYKYRSISLNNLFPNKCSQTVTSDCREEGYNWNASNSKNNIENQKAAITINEIESNGDGIYEDEKQYSYTLSPMQLNAIRKYNQKAGSYANTEMPNIDPFKGNENSLECEQVTYNNGITYSVKCLSSFLNDTSETYFTSNLQRSDTTKFTLWTETDYCTLGNCLDREKGIGPSWK